LKPFRPEQNVKEFGDLILADFPSFAKALELFIKRFKNDPLFSLQSAVTFLEEMLNELPDTAVANRHKILDVVLTDDEPSKVVVIVIRRNAETSEKILEIFHFADLILGDRLSVKPAVYGELIKMLNEAGHVGLLTENHPVWSFDFFRSLVVPQTLDGTSASYGPKFRLVKPMKISVTDQISSYKTYFDDNLFIVH